MDIVTIENIIQETESKWRPVAYASCSMMDMQQYIANREGSRYHLSLREILVLNDGHAAI